MKQKRHLSKNSIAALVTASIFTFALAGTTCGTFAWFMYASRASATFNGVTIGAGELEVGIVSEVEVSDYANYGLTEDTSIPGQRIYWFGTGEMPSETLNHVISLNGSGTNELLPVTSRSYSSGDEFKLYKSPNVGSLIPSKVAPTNQYVYLPLVFRYQDTIEPGVYLPDMDIYMPKAHLTSTEDGSEIHRSMRIYSDNKSGMTHLINPSENQDGSTIVGGALDLDADGFYDVYNQSGNNYEIIYGEVENEVHKDSPEATDSVVPENERTTFHAQHRAGTYAVNEDETIAKVAEYEGFYGFRNKRKSVTRTNANTNNYAYLDMTIYCEGWDLRVIDAEKGNPFSLDLEFKVVI